eukprot:9111119-Pyramimonas_sp.AAC.1
MGAAGSEPEAARWVPTADVLAQSLVHVRPVIYEAGNGNGRIWQDAEGGGGRAEGGGAGTTTR